MNLTPSKKIYFISDFHLGVPNALDSRKREDKIVAWLNSISHDAQILYLMGDVFDYWFEYKEVVPRGYVRLLGKLAELSDAGVEIHYFTGNHDMWVFDYFQKEIGLQLHRAPIQKEYNGKKFFLGHGDGLGPGDFGYKFIKKLFANQLAQWLFARVHPNTGIGLMKFFSRKSRIATGTTDDVYLGDDKEWLMIYCREVLQTAHYDYFIFGHRHLPLDKPLNNQSRYLNLGEWINHFTYAEFDGQELLLKKFNN